MKSCCSNACASNMTHSEEFLWTQVLKTAPIVKSFHHPLPRCLEGISLTDIRALGSMRWPAALPHVSCLFSCSRERSQGTRPSPLVHCTSRSAALGGSGGVLSTSASCDRCSCRDELCIAPHACTSSLHHRGCARPHLHSYMTWSSLGISPVPTLSTQTSNSA